MPPSVTPTDLSEKYSLFQGEYIRLLNSKDVLLNWGKPQLEALYSVKLGQFQLQRLQLQLSIKGLKRKIELVHAAINTGAEVNFMAIEMQIAEELAYTELPIMAEAQKISDARYLLTNLHSPERSAELRQVFRQLAKVLHPDVNPEFNEEQMAIWHKVKDAYATGDLERLKALQVVYEKEIAHSRALTDSLSDEELQIRLAVLREGILVLEEEVEQIKAVFPFTIESQLKDDEWVAAQVAELKEEIAKLQEYDVQLTNEYGQLMQLYGD